MSCCTTCTSLGLVHLQFSCLHILLLNWDSYVNIVISTQDSGRIAIPQESVQEFWDLVTQTAQEFATHPGRGRLQPLGLHGDDGQYNAAGDKLTLLTVNPLLLRETIKDSAKTRFPLLAIREWVCINMEETLYPPLRILAWSFNILFAGIHPQLDWQGESYMKGKPRYPPGTPIAGLLVRNRRCS